MPVYVYECPNHGQFEKIMHIDELVQKLDCPVCGGQSGKIPAPFATHCDSAEDVKWLNSACKTLLPDDHKPLETRGEYKQYLKDNGVIERS